MFSPSIRQALLVRCGLGIGALFVLLSASVYFLVRQGLYQEVDDSLRETASILANQMEYENGGIIFEWEEGLGTNSDISDQALFQSWNLKDGKITRSPALGEADLPQFSGPEGTPGIESISIPQRLPHARAIGLIIYPDLLPEESRELARTGKAFDPKLHPHALVVARDLAPMVQILTKLAMILTVGTLVTLGIGFFLISRAISSSLAPIKHLTREVRAKSGNQFDAAIILPENLPSELTPLAESFDELLGRVEAIRDRERDFIRHAAHELRTPIAALESVTELALSRQRSAEEYERHLKDCARTSAQLSGLVQRLAGLARIGPGCAPARISEVDFPEILNACLVDFAKRFSEKAITVEISGGGETNIVKADPVLLRLILNNLLDNAASYASAGSTLTIDIRRNGDMLESCFTNLPEVGAENPERFFEPLFRQDASRTDIGGSHLGIGLTLSRDAAQLMGGKLDATQPEKKFIAFSLLLPGR